MYAGTLKGCAGPLQHSEFQTPAETKAWAAFRGREKRREDGRLETKHEGNWSISNTVFLHWS